MSLKLLKSLRKRIKSRKGEMATLLTLVSLGLMLIGAAVGTFMAQRETRTRTKAAGQVTCSSNCQSKQDGSYNFCYNECVPGKPGYSRPVGCNSSGFKIGNDQADPACGSSGTGTGSGRGGSGGQTGGGSQTGGSSSSGFHLEAEVNPKNDRNLSEGCNINIKFVSDGCDGDIRLDRNGQMIAGINGWNMGGGPFVYYDQWTGSPYPVNTSVNFTGWIVRGPRDCGNKSNSITVNTGSDCRGSVSGETSSGPGVGSGSGGTESGTGGSDPGGGIECGNPCTQCLSSSPAQSNPQEFLSTLPDGIPGGNLPACDQYDTLVTNWCNGDFGAAAAQTCTSLKTGICAFACGQASAGASTPADASSPAGASAPPGTSAPEQGASTISGTVKIYGNFPQYTYTILIKRCTGADTYCEAWRGQVPITYNPGTPINWSWNRANSGTQYPIQAFLIYSGNVVAQSPTYTIRAPALNYLNIVIYYNPQTGQQQCNVDGKSYCSTENECMTVGSWIRGLGCTDPKPFCCTPHAIGGTITGTISGTVPTPTSTLSASPTVSTIINGAGGASSSRVNPDLLAQLLGAGITPTFSRDELSLITSRFIADDVSETVYSAYLLAYYQHGGPSAGLQLKSCTVEYERGINECIPEWERT